MSSDPLVIGRVIGEVVDSFCTTVKMCVTYNSNKHVCNGLQLLPSTLTSKPKVEVHGGDLRTFYTLIMTDPDAPGPSDPYLREHLHCSDLMRNGRVVSVSHAPLENYTVVNVSRAPLGKEVVSYEMPRPNIGIHRIVFLLYKQKKRLQLVGPPSSRDGFNSRKFAEEYELGLPVAAVFFNCQRETAAAKKR